MTQHFKISPKHSIGNKQRTNRKVKRRIDRKKKKTKKVIQGKRTRAIIRANKKAKKKVMHP